jgi:hypothetical protein
MAARSMPQGISLDRSCPQVGRALIVSRTSWPLPLERGRSHRSAASFGFVPPSTRLEGDRRKHRRHGGRGALPFELVLLPRLQLGDEQSVAEASRHRSIAASKERTNLCQCFLMCGDYLLGDSMYTTAHGTPRRSSSNRGMERE